MQGLKVVGLIVAEISKISKVDVKCVKVTAA